MKNLYLGVVVLSTAAIGVGLILWFVGSKDLIFDALVLDTASIGGIINAYSMH